MMKPTLSKKEQAARRKKLSRLVIVYTLLTLVALFIVIPFYWMILTSLKTAQQIDRIPPLLFLKPGDWQFRNFALALQAAPYARFMLNTVIVAAISTTGTIITTVLAAFAFARINFKGRDVIFMLLISSMMIPGEMFVITNFMTVNTLGWIRDQSFIDALAAMSFPFMTSIFYLFFLRQTFKQVPDELYLAAKVDGTTDFKYLLKVMIPIAKPTIITIIILNAMGTWNAYIWPNLVSPQNANYRLVSNGLRNAYRDLAGQVAYNEQMAAALIVTIPLLIVFLLLKKQIMRGVSRSGIKG
jgi:multiple sugar transport system permease protein